MSYQHFTLIDREKLYGLKQQGKSNGQIAFLLEKDVSSIGRELKRNKPELLTEDDYLPSYAHKKSNERRKSANSTNKEWSEECLNEIKTRLNATESPEQLSYRMKREGKQAPSHETIYKMLYENREEMGIYLKKLRTKRKKRRQRGLKNKKRSLIPNRIGIESRPPIEGKGHWEGDTIIGKDHRGAIATYVDKTTKYFIAQLIEDKTSQSLNKATKESFSKVEFIKTFTFDNGLEFAGHEELTKILGVECYFANPYHSWERGLNEHTNRLLRQFFPKKTDFRQITNDQVQEAVRIINNRPRKSLNYLTPNEVYFNHANCQSKCYSSNLDLYQPIALQT